MYFFFFFFSSRRRHTRSLCDWSSDVCSSDLLRVGRGGTHVPLHGHAHDRARARRADRARPAAPPSRRAAARPEAGLRRPPPHEAREVRLFIAVFPPRDVQTVAYRAADPLRPGHDAVAWVRIENLHYTMRFLGDIDEAGAARASAAMREAAGSRPKFGAALGGFGAFPSAKRARVLWIGMLQGAEPMRLLASALDAALARRGFESADESFEPHLTVGRVRAPGDWTARLLDAPTIEARFQVDRLQLVN